jgi:hypothetical protein
VIDDVVGLGHGLSSWNGLRTEQPSCQLLLLQVAGKDIVL